jgi:hypothetical protein
MHPRLAALRELVRKQGARKAELARLNAAAERAQREAEAAAKRQAKHDAQEARRQERRKRAEEDRARREQEARERAAHKERARALRLAGEAARRDERAMWEQLLAQERRRPQRVLWNGRERAPPIPTRERDLERHMNQRAALVRAVRISAARSATGFATTGEVYQEYLRQPLPAHHAHLTPRRVTDVLKMMAADAMIRRLAHDGGREGRTYLHALPLMLDAPIETGEESA